MSAAINPPPYIQGRPSVTPEPLARYLPPLPDGVLSTWLKRNLPPGSWVLDPFCASPRLVIEAAQAGYRVLVAANNPVSRFLLQMRANPPTEADLHAALAELAATHKGEERIEPHIRSLYQTECERCNHLIMADTFLWEQGAKGPYARIYRCPYCNDNGERAVSQADINRADQFTVSALHRLRALERVAPMADPDRIHAEEAISVYLSRAVYGLFTLINKLDGMPLSPARRDQLVALLLNTCDLANVMWKHPTERERRRQLTIPPRFRENNIWLALENSIALFAAERYSEHDQAIPLIYWPEKLTGEAGICLFEGKLKDLADSLHDLDIKAVCSVLPRPNQAFWTLSALWSGWLWGKDAALPFKSVLRRQRYDWAWHTTALHAALDHLGAVMPDSTPFFGIIGEVEPGFLAASLIAADAAGFELQGISLRGEDDPIEITWRLMSKFPQPDPKATLEHAAIQGAMNLLEVRSEPTSQIALFAAAVGEIAHHRLFRATHTRMIELPVPRTDEVSDTSPADWYAHTILAARQALTYRAGFLRYAPTERGNITQAYQSTDQGVEATDSSDISASTESNAEVEGISAAPARRDRPSRSSEIIESGLLWLRDDSHAASTPLADRYETTVVNYLLKNPGCSTEEIDLAICTAFPHLLTPDLEFLQVCLDSYAESGEIINPGWYINPQDQSTARRQDLETVTSQIIELGTQLGFSIQRQTTDAGNIGGSSSTSRVIVQWLDSFNQIRYWFYPIASAVIGEIVLHSQAQPSHGIIVLPGGRANLVAYKLRRDPRLARLCNPALGGWRLVKFRHIRWLLQNPLLSRESFDELLGQDPLTYTTPQLRLL